MYTHSSWETFAGGSTNPSRVGWNNACTAVQKLRAKNFSTAISANVPRYTHAHPIVAASSCERVPSGTTHESSAGVRTYSAKAPLSENVEPMTKPATCCPTCGEVTFFPVWTTYPDQSHPDTLPAFARPLSKTVDERLCRASQCTVTV